MRPKIEDINKLKQQARAAQAEENKDYDVFWGIICDVNED
jgi:hypothetical protein